MLHGITVNGHRKLRHRAGDRRRNVILAKLGDGDGNGLIEALGLDVDA
jgi:hypothetical protein